MLTLVDTVVLYKATSASGSCMLTMVDKVVLYRATSTSRSVVTDVEHNTDALTSPMKQSAFMALVFRYVTSCRRLYSVVSEISHNTGE